MFIILDLVLSGPGVLVPLTIRRELTGQEGGEEQKNVCNRGGVVQAAG